MAIQGWAGGQGAARLWCEITLTPFSLSLGQSSENGYKTQEDEALGREKPGSINISSLCLISCVIFSKFPHFFDPMSSSVKCSVS